MVSRLVLFSTQNPKTFLLLRAHRAVPKDTPRLARSITVGALTRSHLPSTSIGTRQHNSPTNPRPGRSIDVNDLDRLSQAWRSISDSYAGREGFGCDVASLIASQDPRTRGRLTSLFAKMAETSENLLTRLGVPLRQALDRAHHTDDLRRIRIQLQELKSANAKLTQSCNTFQRLLPGLTEMRRKYTEYENRLASLERMAGSAGSGATTASSGETRPHGVGWR